MFRTLFATGLHLRELTTCRSICSRGNITSANRRALRLRAALGWSRKCSPPPRSCEGIGESLPDRNCNSTNPPSLDIRLVRSSGKESALIFRLLGVNVNAKAVKFYKHIDKCYRLLYRCVERYCRPEDCPLMHQLAECALNSDAELLFHCLKVESRAI